MAEYNTNPYETNSKNTDTPYLVNGNSDRSNQNGMQVMDMRKVPGPLNGNNSNHPIRNEDIVVMQDLSKLPK